MVLFLCCWMHCDAEYWRVSAPGEVWSEGLQDHPRMHVLRYAWVGKMGSTRRRVHQDNQSCVCLWKFLLTRSYSQCCVIKQVRCWDKRIWYIKRMYASRHPMKHWLIILQGLFQWRLWNCARQGHQAEQSSSGRNCRHDQGMDSSPGNKRSNRIFCKVYFPVCKEPGSQWLHDADADRAGYVNQHGLSRKVRLSPMPNRYQLLTFGSAHIWFRQSQSEEAPAGLYRCFAM